MRKLLVLLAIASTVLAVLAGGCGAAKAAENPRSQSSVPALGGQSLAGTSWVLQSYGDPSNLTSALSRVEVTLSFNSDTTQISGSGGVNGYGGDCLRTDNQLTLSGILHTMMASTDQAVNQQENAYFQLLGTAQSVAFGTGTLTINCAGGQVLNFTASETVTPTPNLIISPPPTINTAPMTSATSGGTVTAPVTTAAPPVAP